MHTRAARFTTAARSSSSWQGLSRALAASAPATCAALELAVRAAACPATVAPAAAAAAAPSAPSAAAAAAAVQPPREPAAQPPHSSRASAFQLSLLLVTRLTEVYRSVTSADHGGSLEAHPARADEGLLL
jgi:hypothetical protein